MWQIKSISSENTERIGREIGARLRGGEVVELASDLGGGKTTFVRGLAAGMGSQDSVSSPSFTISQVYKSEKLTLHHYDFYRLGEPGLMAQELSEVLEDPEAVVVVEWAGAVEDVLPGQRVTITIKAISENEREFNILLSPAYEYLRGNS